MNIHTNSCQLFRLHGSSGFATALIATIFVFAFGISVYAGIKLSPRFYIASATILVFGTATCWVLFHQTEVTLDRGANSASVSKRMLHGAHRYDVSLSDIRQADVDIRQGKNKGTTYRLVLVAQQNESHERLIISHGFSPNRKSMITARLINEWLGVPEAAVGTSDLRRSTGT
ncbi:MAG: hypothetical protein MRY81_15585 [Donghicola eburneus]|jgi:hypothetical protein|nr:hypothetical protein [Donghicola eburneus]MCI5041092.1 hypothetical protein [Donghicola eburneus]